LRGVGRVDGQDNDKVEEGGNSVSNDDYDGRLSGYYDNGASLLAEYI